jgi:Fe-S-cluster containining protein
MEASNLSKSRSPTMLILVIVTFVAALVVVLAFSFVAFVDVAFGEGANRADIFRRLWQPPPVHEGGLRSWAAKTVEHVASMRLGRKRTHGFLGELTREIETGVTHAIDSACQTPVSTMEQDCRQRRFAMIGVSASEVTVLADYLRLNRPPKDVARIHERAQRNAELTSRMTRPEYENSEITCPLLGGDESCEAYPVRPLACRNGSVDRCKSTQPATDGRPACQGCEERLMEDDATAISSGAEAGLQRAFEAVALDHSLYELNSALATALEIPNAGERFVRGERVFAGCKKLD